MSKKEFDKFIKGADQKSKSIIDLESIKNRWYGHLNLLFNDIQSWLKEYIDESKVKIELNNIDLYEEALGNYSVKEAKIIIGDKIAKLTPIGTILIGTIGRVDLIGRFNSVKFILADKNATGPKIEFREYTSEEEMRKSEEEEKKLSKPEINWVWKISSPPPRLRYSELNQDTFLDCLMRVING